jgi:hypothetical protein
MKTYARIQDGRVAELFATDADMRQLFHASLMWVDVTAQDAVDIGWTFDGANFAAPAEISRPTAAGVTIADLQRQLALLNGQLAALAGG